MATVAEDGAAAERREMIKKRLAETKARKAAAAEVRRRRALLPCFFVVLAEGPAPRPACWMRCAFAQLVVSTAGSGRRRVSGDTPCVSLAEALEQASRPNRRAAEEMEQGSQWDATTCFSVSLCSCARASAGPPRSSSPRTSPRGVSDSSCVARMVWCCILTVHCRASCVAPPQRQGQRGF
jgi:hypothetical protein